MRRFVLKIIGLMAVSLAATPLFATASTSLIGAGSSFAYPLIARWAAGYKQQTGQKINYQSIGSGGGLSQLKQHTIDFAAVDMPQSTATLKKYHWVQFPLAIGGLVVAIHVPGIDNNALRLNGATLANIFLGKITRWDDAAIASLNPRLVLPSMAIIVIHRADGSGTTFNFTQYLSAVSPTWAQQVGSNTDVAWPAGISGKGNSGVAMFTQRIPGSISYTEYSFAKLTNLTTVQLQNAAGNFLTPTEASFRAATEEARWHSATHFNQLLINQAGNNSWPIVATTFALMSKNYNHKTMNQQILHFIYWGYTKGSDATRTLDYIVFPTSLLQLIKSYWRQQLGIAVQG